MIKKTVILILLLSSTITVVGSSFNDETNDYRPKYNFSYDVFDNLFYFPEDFFDIKLLLETQQIMPSTLSFFYYQPELIPSWEYYVEKVYENQKQYARYGMSVYPSRFDIFGFEKGTTTKVSTFVYSNFGVQVYQGVEIYLSYDEKKADARLLTNSTCILSPTYPKFIRGWMQLIEIEITALEQGNLTISICEDKVSNPEYYKEIYGQNNFTTGGSVLGLRIPRSTIYTYASPLVEEAEEETDFMFTFIYNYLFPIIIVLFILIMIYGGFRFVKKEKEVIKK